MVDDRSTHVALPVLPIRADGWSVQNILGAIAILFTTSGVLVGAYWSVQQSLSAHQATLMSIQARLDIAEHAIQQRTDADDRFASEMRAALQQINLGIADLRVLEAQRARK